MHVSAPQLALKLGLPASVVTDHARLLSGRQDRWGRWVFDLDEARRRVTDLPRGQKQSASKD